MKHARNSCMGAGDHQGGSQGGARWTNRGVCSVCGKNLKLTPSGRIPRHVPAKPGAAHERFVVHVEGDYFVAECRCGKWESEPRDTRKEASDDHTEHLGEELIKELRARKHTS